MKMKTFSRMLSRRYASQGIYLTPAEIQATLQELLSGVRKEFRLGPMTTDEILTQLLSSSSKQKDQR